MMAMRFACPLRTTAASSSLRRLISRNASSSTVGHTAIEDEAIFGPDHAELRNSLNKLIENEINPNVDEWEKAGRFPAKEVGIVHCK